MPFAPDGTPDNDYPAGQPRGADGRVTEKSGVMGERSPRPDVWQVGATS